MRPELVVLFWEDKQAEQVLFMCPLDLCSLLSHGWSPHVFFSSKPCGEAGFAATCRTTS